MNALSSFEPITINEYFFVLVLKCGISNLFLTVSYLFLINIFKSEVHLLNLQEIYRNERIIYMYTRVRLIYVVHSAVHLLLD